MTFKTIIVPLIRRLVLLAMTYNTDHAVVNFVAKLIAIYIHSACNFLCNLMYMYPCMPFVFERNMVQSLVQL